MAAINTAIDAAQDEINGIIPGLTALKATLGTTYSIKFGASGDADGNDVIGLRSKLITASKVLTELANKYNASEMASARLAKTGEIVPDFRDDLLALNTEIETLNTLIENNTSAFLSPSLIPGQVAIAYPSLTGPQRAAVLIRINAILALII